MTEMKLIAFEVRPDEMDDIKRLAKKWGVEVATTMEVPSFDNVRLVEGSVGVSTLGMGQLNRELLTAWANVGVKYVSTRTVGYDHIDLAAAHDLGIRVCNANYAPNGVAEFTIMMIIMSLRNYKQAIARARVNDFALAGLEGRELKDLTVGVMGTGRIGQKVIELLSVFGCEIIAYDHFEKPGVAKLATYVSKEELFERSDVITLHLPAFDSTYHIIDADAISSMKDGVVLVNCARGELVDLSALVDGIETEKIGAIAMDTVEGEKGVAHLDRRTDIIANRDLFYLMQFRNVIITQHMAFYTDAAVASMVECGIEGIVRMAQSDERYTTEL